MTGNSKAHLSKRMKVVIEDGLPLLHVRYIKSLPYDVNNLNRDTMLEKVYILQETRADGFAILHLHFIRLTPASSHEHTIDSIGLKVAMNVCDLKRRTGPESPASHSNALGQLLRLSLYRLTVTCCGLNLRARFHLKEGK